MKIYIQPNLRIVDLTTEGIIANSLGKMTVDKGKTTDTEWTEKKSDMWESEGIWK